MLRKKFLALVLVLMVGMGMLAGCSPVEENYYSLMKEASNQKIFEDVGSIQLGVMKLPDSLFNDESGLNKDVIQKAFNQHRIEYCGKVDVNQNYFQYDFTIVNNLTGDKYGPFTMIFKEDVFYLKTDNIVSHLEKYANTEQKQNVIKMLSDVEYISLSSQDFDSMMPEGAQTGIGQNMLQKSYGQQMLGYRLIDALIKDAYNNYDANRVIKNNNCYTFKLQGGDSVNLLMSLAAYSINNIDKIGSVVTTFLNGLSTAELFELGIDAQMKAEALQGIDFMVKDVNENRSKYLEQIENLNNISPQELSETLNDSEIVSSIEKTDAQTYQMSSWIHIHITAGSPTETAEMTFYTKHMIKVKEAVDIMIPTTKVLTFKELQNQVIEK